MGDEAKFCQGLVPDNAEEGSNKQNLKWFSAYNLQTPLLEGRITFKAIEDNEVLNEQNQDTSVSDETEGKV